jgi:ABC-2 type transport system permease protein
MRSLAIARANVARMWKDRSNVFFVFILPIGIILLIGSMFGGSFLPSLGVVAEDTGPLGDRLVEALEADGEVEVVRYGDENDVVRQVERGAIDAGVVIPLGYDARLRAGEDVEIGFVARPEGVGPRLRATVDAVVSEQASTVRAALFTAESTGMAFEDALQRATEIEPSLSDVEVSTGTIGEEVFGANLGQFDLGASSQLVLFMYLTGLTGSAALIESRRLGVSRRMLSTPISTNQIIFGESLGRFGVVLLQGLYIMAATLLVFGVNWGDPLGAAAILVLFGAVGAGAAMLMGTLYENDEQAGGAGVVAGLGIAALGGCMIPLEFFSPTMQTVAHLTPHAWALDGFAELVRRDGTIADILPELGVLAGYAAVLVALASWRYRRVITRS